MLIPLLILLRGEYRTHLAVMDQVAGTYNFNGNINMKLNEMIKDGVDPKGILERSVAKVVQREHCRMASAAAQLRAIARMLL